MSLPEGSGPGCLEGQGRVLGHNRREQLCGTPKGSVAEVGSFKWSGHQPPGKVKTGLHRWGWHTGGGHIGGNGSTCGANRGGILLSPFLGRLVDDAAAFVMRTALVLGDGLDVFGQGTGTGIVLPGPAAYGGAYRPCQR